MMERIFILVSLLLSLTVLLEAWPSKGSSGNHERTTSWITKSDASLITMPKVLSKSKETSDSITISSHKKRSVRSAPKVTKKSAAAASVKKVDNSSTGAIIHTTPKLPVKVTSLKPSVSMGKSNSTTVSTDTVTNVTVKSTLSTAVVPTPTNSTQNEQREINKDIILGASISAFLVVLCGIGIFAYCRKHQNTGGSLQERKNLSRYSWVRSMLMTVRGRNSKSLSAKRSDER